MRLKRSGRHFVDNNFKCILLNENICILIQVSFRFVPDPPIYNKPSMVQIMALYRKGRKPLFEAMMTEFTDAGMRHSTLIIIIIL